MSSPPGLPALVFPRERALARLEEVTRARVALLVAEAGAGKSLLLSQFLEAAPFRYLRFDLRAEHAGFSGFVRGLAETIAPDVRTIAAGSSENVGPESIAAASAWISEHIGQAGVTIVLDELHQLSDPSGWSLINEAIETTPPYVRWILSTRSSDLLPVARWLANNITTLPLDDEDLRVNVPEALAAIARAPLYSEDEIRRLVAVTKGSALRLSLALSGDREALTIARDHVYDRLLSRVLEAITEDDRALLFEAALYGRFDSALLVASGRNASAAHRLRNTGLTAPSGSGAEIFREPYRSRLLERLRSDPRREAVVMRVADALQTYGRDIDALHVLFEHGTTSALVSALGNIGLPVLERGINPLLYRIFQSIRDDDFTGNAAVLSIKACLESLRERFDLAEAYYGLAIDSAASDDPLRRAAKYRYGRDLVRNKRPNDAIALLESELRRVDGDSWGPSMHALLGIAYLAAKKPELALESTKRAFDGIHAVGDTAVRAQIMHSAAYVAHGTGDFESAVDLAERAVVLADRANAFDIVARALSTLYSISIDTRDDVPKALEYAMRIDDAGRRGGDAFMRSYALTASYELAVLMGDTHLITQFNAAIRPLAVELSVEAFGISSLLPGQAMEAAWEGRFEHSYRLLKPSADREINNERKALRWAECAVYAAAAALRPDALQALALARRFLRSSRTSVITTRARIWLALAHVILGHDGRARALLRELRMTPGLSAGAHAQIETVEALRARWATGWYDDDDGRQFDALLRTLRAAGFGGVARLIGALPVPLSEGARVLTLTGAEVDILRQLAMGATSREIGDALGISANTVDGHVRAICRKLNSRGRRRAVLIGIREGLIDVSLTPQS